MFMKKETCSEGAIFERKLEVWRVYTCECKKSLIQARVSVDRCHGHDSPLTTPVEQRATPSGAVPTQARIS